MKTKANYLKFLSLALISLIMVACGGDDDEPTIDPPRAIFEFEVASDNSGTVTFNNLSIDADSYTWDFGDGSGTSMEENPTHTYASSDKYTVTLTVVNEGGDDETTLEVPVATNIVTAGDMSNTTAWTFRKVWTDEPDNDVLHDFVDGAFVWDNADGVAWSSTYLYQEVAIEAGKEYKFSADVSSTSGTTDIWFELYLGNSDPATDDEYTSNGLRLYISSFDDPESGCANDPFNGDFVTVSQNCTPNADRMKILDPDGTFTLTAEELTANGTIYLVFKSGSWNSPDNYKDGIVLDNVAIVEVL